MGLLTTCIGAYPKPDYVNLPDWFEDLDTPDPTSGWAEAMDAMGEEAIEILNRGTQEAVLDQVNAGIDIPTDGEIARGKLYPLPLPTFGKHRLCRSHRTASSDR